MIQQKEGFQGEHSVALPPMAIDMERADELASSLYVTDIGYYPNAVNHYRARPQPIDQYVLIYCADGSGFYTLQGEQHQVERGHVFILPAGQPHAYGACKGRSWTIYWIHFGGTQAPIYAEGMQTPHCLSVAPDSRIRDRIGIFEEIISTLQESYSLESLRYASSALHHLLASMRFLRQFRSASGQQPEAVPVDAAIHYMRENIGNRITLQDVLNYVGYSQSHLSAAFKKRTGQSPLAYFNLLKTQHAATLLKETDLKVNQICYRIGIEDPFYFSRLFSKNTGMSPTEFRQRCRRKEAT